MSKSEWESIGKTAGWMKKAWDDDYKGESLEYQRELTAPTMESMGPADPTDSYDPPEPEETEYENWVINDAGVMELIGELPENVSLDGIFQGAGMTEHERWKYFNIRDEAFNKTTWDLDAYIESLEEAKQNKLRKILMEEAIETQPNRG